MKYFLSFVCALASVLPGISVLGYQELAGDIVSLKQMSEENVYAAGNMVTVGAKVEGDVVVAGNSVTIKDAVTADVIAAGNELNFRSVIGQDLRAAGNIVGLESVVGGDAMVAGNVIVVGEDAVLEGGAALSANQLVIEGTIKGKTKLSAEEITLGGTIVGNVEIRARKLTILTGAKIQGNVSYALKKGLEELKGITQGELKALPEMMSDYNRGKASGMRLLTFMTLLALGSLFFFGFHGLLSESVRVLKQKPFPSLLVGLCVYVLIPVVSIILAVTLVGLPLAGLALAGYIFLWIFVQLYVVLFGAVRLDSALWSHKRGLVRTLLQILALAVMSVLVLIIPYVFVFIAALFVVGAGTLYKYKLYKSIMKK